MESKQSGESYFLLILGASANPERYSYQLIKQGLAKNHEVIPINPFYQEIDGIKVFESIKSWFESAHLSNKKIILSIYLNQQKALPLLEDMTNLNPHQVILNPGADSLEIQNELEKKNLSFITACSLVLMTTDRFVF